MEGLPDKLTFSVEEVAKLIGVARGVAYRLVRSGELRCVSVGKRRLVTRQALAEFLEVQDDSERVAAALREGAGAKHEEVTEWTYVVTVKRLRANETVRVEPRNRLSNW